MLQFLSGRKCDNTLRKTDRIKKNVLHFFYTKFLIFYGLVFAIATHNLIRNHIWDCE